MSAPRRARVAFVALAAIGFVAIVFVATATSAGPTSVRVAEDPAPRPEVPSGDSARRYSEEFRRGFEHLQQGRYEAGVASMKRCLEISPDEPNCAYNIACGLARLGRVDEGLSWFERAADWGYGYDPFADDLAACEVDEDLAPLRGSARFTAAVGRMRAYRDEVVAYVNAPAIHVPAGVDRDAPVPLVVVLHASGATKRAGVEGRWKRAADELRVAIVAPSACLPVQRDPARGTAWFLGVSDYSDPARTAAHETTILPAIDAIERRQRIDRTRIVLAGESEGAIVALRVAFAHPDVFSGVLADEGAFVPRLLAESAPRAHDLGLRVHMLLDRDDFRARLAADPTIDPSAVLAQWTSTWDAWGFAGVLETYTRDGTGPDGVAPGSRSGSGSGADAPASDGRARRVTECLRLLTAPRAARAALDGAGATPRTPPEPVPAPRAPRAGG